METVEAYLQTLPEETRSILEKIRSMIKETAPEAVEQISYAIPAFELNGKPLIYFAGYAEHVSLYPIPDGPESFQNEIAPHKKGKGTLQFSLSEPIPYVLIQKVVDQSFAEHIKRNS